MTWVRILAEIALALALYMALLRRPSFARASRGRQYLIFLPIAAALFVAVELIWPLSAK